MDELTSIEPEVRTKTSFSFADGKTKSKRKEPLTAQNGEGATGPAEELSARSDIHAH
jgi:hypothetical protein